MRTAIKRGFGRGHCDPKLDFTYPIKRDLCKFYCRAIATLHENYQ